MKSKNEIKKWIIKRVKSILSKTQQKIEQLHMDEGSV